MNTVILTSLFFGAVISIAGYIIGIFLNKKLPVINPLLTAIVFVIIIIKIFNIDYETYNIGAEYISYLLTPATVCLAIPLYRQRKLTSLSLSKRFCFYSIKSLSIFSQKKLPEAAEES